MKYLLFVLFLIIIFTPTQTGEKGLWLNKAINKVYARQEAESWQAKEELTVKGVEAYLKKYGSPLSGSAEEIIEIGDRYRLGYAILLAIARKESSLGRFYLKNNIMGIGGSDRLWSFARMEDSIEKAAKLISQDSYYTNFRRTGNLYDLARVYCPPMAKEWARGVTDFKKEIENEAPDYRIN